MLQKIGIKHSHRCDFCEERDVVEHAFFKCERLYSFWNSISKRLNNKLKKRIVLNETSVILGIEQEQQNLPFQEKRFINTIFALGKFSIIKNKTNKINIDIIFEREVKLRKIEF